MMNIIRPTLLIAYVGMLCGCTQYIVNVRTPSMDAKVKLVEKDGNKKIETELHFGTTPGGKDLHFGPSPGDG